MSEPELTEQEEYLLAFLQSPAWRLVRDALRRRVQLHAGVLIASAPHDPNEAFRVMCQQQSVISELTAFIENPATYLADDSGELE